MHRQTKVRSATVLDLLPLAELAQRYSDSVPRMRNHKLHVPTFMQNVAMSIVADSGYVAVLIIDGVVHGAFWGCISTMPWSDAKVAQDICFFVDDDYRGHGVKLIHDWMRWAKAQGAVEVCLSSASGIDTWRTQQLFKRFGFTQQGEAYSKEL